MRPLEPYNHDKAVEEWQSLPIDNVGYLPVTSLLNMPEHILRALIDYFSDQRYALDGWRNHDNLWRDKLGLDTTHGKTVLDFGCGIGLESLQFAKAGNRIILADIGPNSVRLAERVLRTYDYVPAETLMVSNGAPWLEPASEVDVFYANGVLHHTPHFRAIIERAAEVLAPVGEIRLMLYSDIGWSWATGTLPPDIDQPTAEHEQFQKFVTTFDSVGHYADWFSAEKISYLVGDFLTLISCDYITDNGRYLVAKLRVK